MPDYLTRRDVLQCAAALFGVRIARGQDAPVFSADVKVVNVLATVRNKTGSLAGNLNQDDFSLSEDGRPQTIRYFARDTDLPLTQIRQALTSSVGNLADALAYVDTETQRQLRMQHGGGTMLYDAVAQASNEIMKKQSGRKALIVLTDGVDLGSYGTLKDAVEAAERADTLIYSILYSDPGAYGVFGGGAGRRILERMSNDTGGSFFEVSREQTVDRMFDILQEELRNQYNLGYVSDKPITLSEFRTIQLAVRQKGLLVQARHQYWAGR